MPDLRALMAQSATFDRYYNCEQSMRPGARASLYVSRWAMNQSTSPRPFWAGWGAICRPILTGARFCHFAAGKHRRTGGGVSPLLFNVVNDPNEKTNLATDPAYMNTIYRLAARMLNHRMRFSGHALSQVKLTDKGAVASVWPAGLRN